ncbi:MAG: chromosomal replication initiator protein DnaA [Phycisphaerales bacterium]|nr:chromosomal replication initiator protein DnaA [Phycisphaerales bacterium]
MSALALVMEEPTVIAAPCAVEASVTSELVVRMESLLRGRIGEGRFEQWFDRKVSWGLAGGTLRLAATNEFAAAWIRNKFLPILLQTAREIIGEQVAVVVECSREAGGKTLVNLTGCDPCVRRIEPMALPQTPPRAVHAPMAQLNAKYALEDFIVGAGNQLAYQAAVRVAEHPGADYNPLFIHGMCGLGKTHLLQGICRRFNQMNPHGKWRYLTGEQFTNEFLEALRGGKMEDFRRRLRRVDLLVIDDVHFFGGKKATQEEFLHTFNQVDSQGRQIVLASDCAPREIMTLAESLASRFVSGMVARIDPPDVPTRLEILRRRALRMGWQPGEAVLMRIANSDAASVRELEGLLLQVMAGGQLRYGSALTGAEVSEEIRRRTQVMLPVAPERILDEVASMFGIAKASLLGQSRQRLAAGARSIAMHLMRRHANMSFPEIGRAFGHRNHSTVIAACNRVEAQIASGNLIAWKAADGDRRESVAAVVQRLVAQLRQPAAGSRSY